MDSGCVLDRERERNRLQREEIGASINWIFSFLQPFPHTAFGLFRTVKEITCVFFIIFSRTGPC